MEDGDAERVRYECAGCGHRAATVQVPQFLDEPRCSMCGLPVELDVEPFRRTEVDGGGDGVVLYECSGCGHRGGKFRCDTAVVKRCAMCGLLVDPFDSPTGEGAEAGVLADVDARDRQAIAVDDAAKIEMATDGFRALLQLIFRR